jgi:hypothetical protein
MECPSDILLKFFENVEFTEILSCRTVCHHWNRGLKYCQPKSLNLENFTCSVDAIFSWLKRFKKRNKHVFQKLECLNVSFPLLMRHHINLFCSYFKQNKSLTTFIAFTHPNRRYDFSVPIFYLNQIFPNLVYLYSNIYPNLLLNSNYQGDFYTKQYHFYELTFNKLFVEEHGYQFYSLDNKKKDFLPNPNHHELCTERIRNLYILNFLSSPMNHGSSLTSSELIPDMEQIYGKMSPNCDFFVNLKKTNLFFEACEISKTLYSCIIFTFISLNII